MANTILWTNATPIYAFLSFIMTKQSQGKPAQPLKILDCGAGGSVPPLAVFSEHGFAAYGIDTSVLQLERARAYCDQHGIEIDLRAADMREIPFDTESFDCVYEHYAMCHLSKRETATAIGEMNRVAKRGGLCFLGVISMDSWPESLYGVEREAGEYWAGDERHSMFTDKEADVLVSEWEVLSKEKRVIYQQATAVEISEAAWQELYEGGGTEAEWDRQYEQRMNLVNYTHIYYILRKR